MYSSLSSPFAVRMNHTIIYYIIQMWAVFVKKQFCGLIFFAKPYLANNDKTRGLAPFLYLKPNANRIISGK